MLQLNAKSSTFIFVSGLILVLLLTTTQVLGNSIPALSRHTHNLPQEQDSNPSPSLDVGFYENSLVGTLTLPDKVNLFRADNVQVQLLDAEGHPLDLVPLHALGLGEFRLVVPLHKIDKTGYLAFQFSKPETKDQAAQYFYHLDCEAQTVTQVQSIPSLPRLSSQGTSTPDEFGYVWDDGVAYTWVDTSGGTSVTLPDDDWAGPFEIGFTFNFYGEPHTNFYMDSNGYIGFDETQENSYYLTNYLALPYPRRPNNIIAPFWDDFNPLAQDAIVRYQTFGTAPNRYLVVEWNNVPFYDGSEFRQTFQVILYEDSYNIKFQYPPTRSGPDGDRHKAAVGIENSDGTIGLNYPYNIPITATRAIQFNYNIQDYNVFMTPKKQGSSGESGEVISFNIKVINLGANSDQFELSRSAYDGANWDVSFFQSDGITPLDQNSTSEIPSGSKQDIVVKIRVPDDVDIGDWTRATIQATSQNKLEEYDVISLDAIHGSSFVQVYTDDESGDGTEDSENYFESIQNGKRYIQRLTTDQDDTESRYIAVATTPDNESVVNLWTKNYYNNQAWVREIEYALLDNEGNLLRPVAKITDHSNSSSNIYDFSPAIDIADNNNMLIGWARQPDTHNVWYTVINTSGEIIQEPVALTSNTQDYPRDYPPTVAALEDGRFLMAWEHTESPTSSVDIKYAILNVDGSIYRSPPERLTDGTGTNTTPRAAPTADGGAAIVWTTYNSHKYSEITYALVNNNGVVLKNPTLITNNGDSGQKSYYADVVGLSDGRIAVAWTQYHSGIFDIQYILLSDSGSQENVLRKSHSSDSIPLKPPSEFLLNYPYPVQSREPGYLPESDTLSTKTKNPTLSPSQILTGGGINGQVTYQGTPIADIHLTLRSQESLTLPVVLTTTTIVDGSYVFTGVPTLAEGQKYYVYYQNGGHGNITNTNYLRSWKGFDIITYTNGDLVAGGNFEIANITLGTPASGITTSFPVNFQWTKRKTALNDNYHLELFELDQPNSLTFHSSPLGYTDYYTLSSLPTGFQTNTQYGWNIWVTDPTDGSGVSYFYNTLAFTDTGRTPGVISGQVTYKGNPIGNINVALRFYNGTEWSTQLTTTTDISGTYIFSSVPGLQEGQRYYVRYSNGGDHNEPNTNYLASWNSFNIITYTGETNLPGGDFDIADVPLQIPNHNITTTLPIAFEWTRRTATLSDTYAPYLFNPTNYDLSWQLTETLGYTNTYLMLSLPNELTFGTPYGWSVKVFGPYGGMGIAHYYNLITFSTTPIPYTIPNNLSISNLYVSLTTDKNDNLIMTWLDNNKQQYLFYALADKYGNIRTPATVFQRTRHTYLWSSWKGYGNYVLSPPPDNKPLIGSISLYLPLTIREAPPIYPVVNGGFELGDFTGWTAGGSVPGLTPQVVTSLPDKGQFSAVLGQENAPCQTGKGGLVGQSWIQQNLRVPSTGSPILKVRYRIRTYDWFDPNQKNINLMLDRFEIYINTNTIVLRTGNTDYSSFQTGKRCAPEKSYDDLGWRTFYYALDNYKGQTIELKMVNYAVPDDWFGTWTYVDEVEIVIPVANGGFEDGEEGWTFDSDITQGDTTVLAPLPKVIADAQAHTGSYVAVLGNKDAKCVWDDTPKYRYEARIEQDIYVPALGNSELTFYYRIFTYDKVSTVTTPWGKDYTDHFIPISTTSPLRLIIHLWATKTKPSSTTVILSTI